MAFIHSLLRVLILCTAMLGAVAFLSACGNSVSLENYQRLKVGQTFDEVKQIIGEPSRCDETLGVRNCVWGNTDRSIRVNFALDKVLLLSADNLK